MRTSTRAFPLLLSAIALAACADRAPTGVDAGRAPDDGPRFSTSGGGPVGGAYTQVRLVSENGGNGFFAEANTATPTREQPTRNPNNLIAYTAPFLTDAPVDLVDIEAAAGGSAAGTGSRHRIGVFTPGANNVEANGIGDMVNVGEKLRLSLGGSVAADGKKAYAATLRLEGEGTATIELFDGATPVGTTNVTLAGLNEGGTAYVPTAYTVDADGAFFDRVEIAVVVGSVAAPRRPQVGLKGAGGDMVRFQLVETENVRYLGTGTSGGAPINNRFAFRWSGSSTDQLSDVNTSTVLSVPVFTNQPSYVVLSARAVNVNPAFGIDAATPIFDRFARRLGVDNSFGSGQERAGTVGGLDPLNASRHFSEELSFKLGSEFGGRRLAFARVELLGGAASDAVQVQRCLAGLCETVATQTGAGVALIAGGSFDEVRVVGVPGNHGLSVGGQTVFHFEN